MNRSNCGTVPMWLAAAAVALGAGFASGSQAATASITIAGSLQSELGCPGDWDPACSTTHLAYDTNDGVWQGNFSVPAGAWQYKAAINDSWTESYGANGTANGANIPITLAAARAVKFYFDDKSKLVTDDLNSRIVTAAGSFQSELGCAGDWDPTCLRLWLQDVDGDGIFTFSTSALPAGNYETRAALHESWDENHGVGGLPGGANIAFSVASSDTPVQFSFVSATNVLTVTVTPPPIPEPATQVLTGLGLAVIAASFRRYALPLAREGWIGPPRSLDPALRPSRAGAPESIDQRQ